MNLTIAQTREVDLEVALRSAAIEEPAHQRDDLPPAPVSLNQVEVVIEQKDLADGLLRSVLKALFNELLQRLGARSRPVGDADLVLG